MYAGETFVLFCFVFLFRKYVGRYLVEDDQRGKKSGGSMDGWMFSWWCWR